MSNGSILEITEIEGYTVVLDLLVLEESHCRETLVASVLSLALTEEDFSVPEANVTGKILQAYPLT
jgi:hypothetical protein